MMVEVVSAMKMKNLKRSLQDGSLIVREPLYSVGCSLESVCIYPREFPVGSLLSVAGNGSFPTE
jgi:hypothetical protein